MTRLHTTAATRAARSTPDPSTPTARLPPPTATTASSGPVSGTFIRGDEDPDGVFSGNGSTDGPGWDIAPMGDLNDDGYDDVIAGASALDGDHPDTNHDGFTGVWFGPVDASALDLDSADVRIIGDADNTYVGGEMHAGVDLNGDGRGDLLMGAGYLEVEGGQTSGLGGGSNRAWIYFSPVPTGTLMVRDADAMIENQDRPGFGIQTCLAGDTNGDGHQEVLVGHYDRGSYLFEVPTGY